MSLSDYRVSSAKFNLTDEQPGKYIRIYYDRQFYRILKLLCVKMSDHKNGNTEMER